MRKLHTYMIVAFVIVLGIFIADNTQAKLADDTDVYTNTAEGKQQEAEFSALFTPKRQGRIHIGVAANFAKPLARITQAFTKITGVDVVTTVSSSGTLFAQILHGATFDVFLSADVNRPNALIDKGVIHAGNVVNYAEGELVYIYRRRDHMNDDMQSPEDVLRSTLDKLVQQQGKVAIANPKLAPYGLAAKQTLENLSLWHNSATSPSRVTGKNVLQTLQFFTTGSASSAFIAKSVLPGLEHQLETAYSVVSVPMDFYSPIMQGLSVNRKQPAVLTPNWFNENSGDNTIAITSEVDNASLFVQFILSDFIQCALPKWGYKPATAVRITMHENSDAVPEKVSC